MKIFIYGIVLAHYLTKGTTVSNEHARNFVQIAKVENSEHGTIRPLPRVNDHELAPGAIKKKKRKRASE